MSHDVREAVEGILTHRNTNRGELPLPADYYGSHATAMLMSDILAAQAAGAVVVDVRPITLFGHGYLAQAVNIPFVRDSLLTRLQALIPTTQPVILYGDNIATAESAAELAKTAGYTVLGVSNVPLPHKEVLPTIDIDGLHRAVLNGATVVDVRDPHEHAKGTIEGAVTIPHLRLAAELSTIPNAPIHLVCESGTRATIAASFLLHHGKQVVAVVVPGGMSDYNAKYAVAHA
jgi:rhodanese-related sulfurtransferase